MKRKEQGVEKSENGENNLSRKTELEGKMERRKVLEKKL